MDLYYCKDRLGFISTILTTFPFPLRVQAAAQLCEAESKSYYWWWGIYVLLCWPSTEMYERLYSNRKSFSKGWLPLLPKRYGIFLPLHVTYCRSCQSTWKNKTQHSHAQTCIAPSPLWAAVFNPISICYNCWQCWPAKSWVRWWQVAPSEKNIWGGRRGSSDQ